MYGKHKVLEKVKVNIKIEPPLLLDFELRIPKAFLV